MENLNSSKKIKIGSSLYENFLDKLETNANVEDNNVFKVFRHSAVSSIEEEKLETFNNLDKGL